MYLQEGVASEATADSHLDSANVGLLKGLSHPQDEGVSPVGQWVVNQC